jgi:hypothetical protein
MAAVTAYPSLTPSTTAEGTFVKIFSVEFGDKYFSITFDKHKGRTLHVKKFIRISALSLHVKNKQDSALHAFFQTLLLLVM